jgi:hypothetical protein
MLTREFFSLDSRTFITAALLTSVTGSVPRRESAGAQHAGRGGAGNVFKADEVDLARQASHENAVDDSSSASDTLAAKPVPAPSKAKNWLFGKKA